MNLRIIKSYTDSMTFERVENTLYEIKDISELELPVPKTTVRIEGQEIYVCSVLKSYEIKDGVSQVWFIAIV